MSESVFRNTARFGKRRRCLLASSSLQYFTPSSTTANWKQNLSEKNLERLANTDYGMDLEKLKSKKIVSLTIAGILVIMIASAFILQESQENSKENVVDIIEFQDRQGNVANTKLYIVKLADGSEFRYSRTIPGPGMLCDTNKTKGNCDTETEPGYTEINSATSSSEYRKQEEDFSTYYYPENRKCATQITERNIKISDCS